MPRRIKSLSRSGPPVKLYLEDIGAIWDVLKDTCEEVILKTEEYEYGSVEEFARESKGIIHKLTFTGSRPYLTVDLALDNSRLYAGADDAKSYGGLEKVRELLKQRRRPVVSVATGGTGIVLLLFAAFLLSYLGAEAIRYRSLWWGIATALVVLIVLYLVVMSFRWITRGNLIIPKHRAEAPSFFRRNQDQLVTGIILSLFGALIGYVLGRVTTH